MRSVCYERVWPVEEFSANGEQCLNRLCQLRGQAHIGFALVSLNPTLASRRKKCGVLLVRRNWCARQRVGRVAGADLDDEHPSAQLVWIDVRDSGDMAPTFGHGGHLDVYMSSAWKAEVHGQDILGAVAAPRVDQTTSQDRARSRRINAHFRTRPGITASFIEHRHL